jgi:hypothetical protein
VILPECELATNPTVEGEATTVYIIQRARHEFVGMRGFRCYAPCALPNCLRAMSHPNMERFLYVVGPDTVGLMF